MRGIIVLLFTLLPFSSLARLQGQARIDSLLKVLPKLEDDTAKVRLLDDLSYSYKTINPAEGIKYGQEALNLATELEWKKGIAMACDKLGSNYQFVSSYLKALEYDFRALKIYEEIKDKYGMAEVESNMANIFSVSRDYAKGLEYNNMALKFFEETHNKKKLATTLGNIGNIYQVTNNYYKALECDLKALDIFIQIDDKTGAARNLGNIGNIYLQQLDYESALNYNFKALAIFDMLGEKNGIGLISGNIGEIYLSIAKDTIRDINPTNYIPKDKKANLVLAIQFLEKGIAICNEIRFLTGCMEFNRELSDAYLLGKEYKNSLLAYRQFTKVKDSVFSQENMQKIALTEGKHDAELNEKKIEVQRLQLLADKKKMYVSAGILVMLVGISIWLINSFRVVGKNKNALEEKNRLIALEKESADILRLRAERSENQKQQFLANMSHEIRTPMNAVNGMTDLLLEKNPRPDQVNYLQVISKSSDILLHIINDILDISKIEVGKLDLESIDFSLSETIKHVCDTLSFRAEEKGLQLATQINSEVGDVVVGDSFRLNQILLNLAGNAIKFTEKGSVAINVSLVNNVAGVNTLQFAVIDTGIGIPADKLGKLFESFSQVNKSDTRKYGGTGLGLAISKQLIELQGGKIWVESIESRGATFFFTLSYPVGSPEKLQQRIQQEQTPDGSMLEGLRILLGEDNDYNRMVVVETLKTKAKMTIDEAHTGREVIRLLNQNDYDVILMDVQMPTLNGLQTTRYIRERLQPPKKNIPIIGLSAGMLKFEIDMIYMNGMNTYVPKPFKAWQLVAAIAEQTGRKSQVGERKTAQPETPTKIMGQHHDLTYLANFCEGDEARMKRYIKLFITAVPVFSDKVNRAMADADMAELTLQVHAFKPKWMMMGMKTSTELGHTIERMIHENQTPVQIRERLDVLLEQNAISAKELEVMV